MAIVLDRIKISCMDCKCESNLIDLANRRYDGQTAIWRMKRCEKSNCECHVTDAQICLRLTVG